MSQLIKNALDNAKGHAAIEVRGLSKRYGELKAVNNVSFTVKKGEILGFLGPNGAGKTTTMRMITGFVSPSEGAVYVNGLNVFDNPLEVKKQIGYLPETPPVYMQMAVRDYLNHVANLKGIPHRYINEQIERSIERCGLGPVQHRLIRHLSKGFRQRVGLGQALLGNPTLLILDEPTVGLDPTQIREVRKLIKDLAKDHTVILSTHILSEVQLICDRLIIIHKGQLVASDTIANLNNSTTDEIRIRVTLTEEDAGARKKLESVPGVRRVRQLKKDLAFELRLESEEPTLLQQLQAKGFDIAEFYNVSPTLEDFFLRIVSGRDVSELEDEEMLAEEEEANASAKQAETSQAASKEDEEEDDDEEESPRAPQLEGVDIKGYNFSEQDFVEVLEKAELEQDDAQALLDKSIELNDGDKSLSRKELEAGAKSLKKERAEQQKALDKAFEKLKDLEYDFSKQDFREVMAAYELDDPEAFSLAVRALEDGDQSLTRQELETAAKVLTGDQSAVEDEEDEPEEEDKPKRKAKRRRKKRKK